MKRKLLTLFAFMLMLAVGTTYAQDLLLGQEMDEVNASGATSAFLGETQYEIADNFENVDGTVTQIVFYGLYAFHDGQGWSNADHEGEITVNVRFYAEDAVEPDWENPVVEHLELTTTSIVNSWTWGNGFEVWEYTVDIPETYIDNGWFSIQSVGGSGWLLWHKSVAGDEYAWQKNWNPGDKNSEFAFIGADKGAKAGALEYDLSFELYGTPGNGGNGGNGGDEGFTVTFNVNMGEAEGFDPDAHEVWVTGNFTGWTEPQEEGSVQMTMVAPAKDGDEVVLIEENFQTWLPEGWTLESTSETTWEQMESLTVSDITVLPVVGDYFAMNSWTDQGGDQDEKLITAAFDLTGYDYAELNFQFFGHYHWSVDPNDNCDLFVRVSTDGTTWVELWNEADHPDFTSTAANYTWLPTVIDLSDYIGNDAVHVKFVYEGFDGAQFGIDDVMVVAGTSAPAEELWYTATVEGIEEETLLYKYFSTHVAAGWAGGEWDGDPNREVELTGDIELFDNWGEQPVSVVENQLAEQGISLFPNPVSTQLTVSNSEVINSLRIFDLTGRMVYSQTANSNTVQINVSELKQGVYVMQVMTANGVSAQKFNVVK